MGHLLALRLVHAVLATLLGLVALLFLALWCIGGILAIRNGHPIGWLFLIGGLLIAALLGGLASLHLKAGAAAVKGRRRILQTALAVLHLMNFPIGTAFAVYALWICWFNEPTKIYFDTHDPRF